MAFYPDMSPYCYHPSGIRAGTLNVGWLDAGHPFETGKVPEGLIQRLLLYCKAPVIQTRGLHFCELCNMSEDVIPTIQFGGETVKIGSAELRVFNSSGEVYACPTMLIHYVMDHSYRPPQAFIDAVMSEPGPGSVEYQERLANL